MSLCVQAGHLCHKQGTHSQRPKSKLIRYYAYDRKKKNIGVSVNLLLGRNRNLYEGCAALTDYQRQSAVPSGGL